MKTEQPTAQHIDSMGCKLSPLPSSNLTAFQEYPKQIMLSAD